MTVHTPDRSDSVVDAELNFRPGDAVRLRVVHRDRRVSVTDDGAAINRAGRPLGWQDAARRIADEFVVNISRHGVVSLPVVRVGPPEEAVIRRIGQASLALYEELLDLADKGAGGQQGWH
ncbi:MAG TPA: hypothetical protein VKR21_14390 [Solirubrobacteraceae bacterium]|nr:hypothetical protein [Solirubrobacteraceae bacterium]